MGKDSLLLRPVKAGNLVLKNRIMFPPMTTAYEERDGSFGTRSLAFYERLAKGGTGFIVIGDVAPVKTMTPTPKLFEDAQIPSFKLLADTLHRYDCKVALQIFHPEYDVEAVGGLIMASRRAAMEAQNAKANGNMELFAEKMAEAQSIGRQSHLRISYDMQHYVSEVGLPELMRIKNAIADSCRRAQTAGIDAVEIHGDRLLGSLCSPILNHREDGYGGSFENRIRYALEVTRAIKEAAPNLMIEYKLPVITKKDNGEDRGKGGVYPEEAAAFAARLQCAGVDMIQVAQANHTGVMSDTIPQMGTRESCWMLDAAKAVKAAVDIPVAIAGKVLTVAKGEELLRSGDVDVICYGRSLLCDPDIAVKVERDEPIRECLNCNKGCLDAIQSRRYISCVLNAENGEEATVAIQPADAAKRVAVVGAGIAGMEAARVAALRGHSVELYEKEKKVGGQILLAAKPPRKAEILRAVAYYEKILPALGVNIRLETEATGETLRGADAVVVAVGAHNMPLPVPGAAGKNVVSGWDVLSGSAKASGHCAVIGGGMVGTETADFLLQQGCTVSVIEMTDRLAEGESPSAMDEIEKDFKEHSVKQYLNTKVVGIENDGRLVRAVSNGEEVLIACDTVVVAVGSRKNSLNIATDAVPVYYAGDCAGDRTADISAAVRSGYRAANKI